jgi:hypothetical protein
MVAPPRPPKIPYTPAQPSATSSIDSIKCPEHPRCTPPNCSRHASGTARGANDRVMPVSMPQLHPKITRRISARRRQLCEEPHPMHHLNRRRIPWFLHSSMAANARTGKVPKPLTLTGTAKNFAPCAGTALRPHICSTMGISAPRRVECTGRSPVSVQSML